MQELVRRVSAALNQPWQKKTGRPRACGLYAAVEVACIYLRHNCVQEFLGDLRGISQPTVSRIVTDLVPVVRSVLAEFVPDPQEAVRLVEGKVCLVDGTITPCWSYAEYRELWSRKHGTTGFCVQLISLLDGTPVWISDPLPGSTHDKTAFDTTATTGIIDKAAAGIGDKGYQGAELYTPTKKPQWRELNEGEKKANAALSALRASVERLVAHFKNWRILHTDYRRPYTTYRDAFDAARAHCSFSRPNGVLNNPLTYEPPTRAGNRMAGENWWITVERFVRQFGQVVDIDDYLARIATYLAPPPTAPVPRYPSPRELPAALDYLNTVWRLRFGTRLLLLDSAERTCTLALDIDTAEEFDARLTALGDVLKGFQVGGTPGVSGHPVDRVAAFLLTNLNEVAAHRVERAAGVLRAIVDIRNGSQHSSASPQAANAIVQLGLTYPVANWATAWYQVRAHAVEALDAVREEIQANAPEASG